MTLQPQRSPALQKQAIWFWPQRNNKAERRGCYCAQNRVADDLASSLQMVKTQADEARQIRS